MGDSTCPSPLGRANTIIADGTEGLYSPFQAGYAGQDLAAALLAKIFRRVRMGIAVRLWSGPTFRVGAGGEADTTAENSAREPPFVLWFRTPRAVVSLVLGRDPLRLADAYFRGRSQGSPRGNEALAGRAI